MASCLLKVETIRKRLEILTLQRFVPRGSPSFWWRLYCVSQTSAGRPPSFVTPLKLAGKVLALDQPQLEPQWWENYDTKTSSEHARNSKPKHARPCSNGNASPRHSLRAENLSPQRNSSPRLHARATSRNLRPPDALAVRCAISRKPTNSGSAKADARFERRAKSRRGSRRYALVKKALGLRADHRWNSPLLDHSRVHKRNTPCALKAIAAQKRIRSCPKPRLAISMEPGQIMSEMLARNATSN